MIHDRALIPPRNRASIDYHWDAVGRARELVLEFGWNATSYQIVNPGIELWFPSSDDGVIGFVRHAGTRVVAGAPVCAPERLADIVEEFERDSRRARQRVCYFGAEGRLEALLRQERRHSYVLLGAQPVWSPEQFVANVESRASLRAQLSRALNKGITIERYDAARASTSVDLRRCLGEWLDTRGLPPLHFLIEPNTLGSLEDRRVAVAVQGGRPIAFLVASPVPCRRGWLIEQIIRGRHAVNGVAELMLYNAVKWMVEAGDEFVTLGLSPLSRRSGLDQARDRADQSTWLKFALAWVRLHGRRFYNFDGLDAFKAKFRPDEWDPVFAIVNRPSVTPRDLVAIAGAFAGTSITWLLIRGTIRAFWAEMKLTRTGHRAAGPAPCERAP